MKRSPRSSVPHYTYRQASNNNEKLIYRRVGIVLLLTVVTLAVIWFWGTSFINLLGFLAKPVEEAPTQVINIPISKPSLKELPEATNKEKITVEGTTSPGQEVSLESSGETLKTTSKNDGSFSFEGVLLKKGLNLIKVSVLDASGEKLEESLLITLDTTAPLLEVTAPRDGATFTAKTNVVKVSGKTEEESIVFINELQAIVSPNGNFSQSYPVKPGSKKLEVKATDKAGNVKKVTITISISSR